MTPAERAERAWRNSGCSSESSITAIAAEITAAVQKATDGQRREIERLRRIEEAAEKLLAFFRRRSVWNGALETFWAVAMEGKTDA